MEDILSEVKKHSIKDLVNMNKRADERDFETYRNIEIETDVVGTAAGSALVRLGKTQVLAAVKFGVETPWADSEKEGMLMSSAELMPFASPMFEAGPPRINAIELARIVDRGIRAGEIIDLKSKKFVVDEDKVVAAFIDLYVLDFEGNMGDACSLAAMAALKTAKIPTYNKETGELDREKTTKLKLEGDVVATTFVKIGDKILIDPCLDEELGRTGKMFISTLDGEKIVAMQKGGEAGFTQKEIDYMMDMSLEKSKELLKLIK